MYDDDVVDDDAIVFMLLSVVDLEYKDDTNGNTKF